MTFATEADLCRAFIETLPEGWTAYPETADFDIVLVRDDGLQVGVEAKLRLNGKVLDQVTEGYWDATRAGPDFRAVLVPYGKTGHLGAVTRLLGLTVLECGPAEMIRYTVHPEDGYDFRPKLPGQERGPRDAWHDCCPSKRLTLPDYIPDAIAGSSSPLRLTDWKIKAIKVCILVERRGYVSRADFKALGLDHRRWINPVLGWLKPVERGLYERGPHFPDFRTQHAVNYDEIAADFERWAPPDHGLQVQGALAMGGRDG